MQDKPDKKSDQSRGHLPPLRPPKPKKPKPSPSTKRRVLHEALKRNRWKPGQSGNPHGAQKHDPALKKLKALTKSELVEVGNLIVKGNMAGLQKAMKKSKGQSVLITMVAGVVDRIINQGDMHALNILLDRLIGKVRDEVKWEGDMPNVPQIIVTLPSNGRMAEENETK